MAAPAGRSAARSGSCSPRTRTSPSFEDPPEFTWEMLGNGSSATRGSYLRLIRKNFAGSYSATGIALVPGNNSRSPIAGGANGDVPFIDDNRRITTGRDTRCGRAGSWLSLGCAAWVLLILKNAGGDQVGRHSDRRRAGG